MRLAGLTCAAVALLVTGCGSMQGESRAPGDTLRVYSALPLRGPEADRARDVLAGERLALARAGARAGRFRIAFRSRDDATAEGWDPDRTLKIARQAADDPDAIAYLGDLDAGATALSLPTTNAAGVLQVTPAATYAGFTGGPGAGEGEPERYYPAGTRTFGRVPPPDPVQAQAQVGLLAGAGCRRVAVFSAPDAFDRSLARLVAGDATERGLEVVVSVPVRPDPDAQRAAARDAAFQRAGCATFAGGLSDAPAGLFAALHAALPGAPLVAPMALCDRAFTRALTPAVARATRIVGPPPLPGDLRAALRRAGAEQAGPWAAYGYEAMRAVLDAVRRAGADGNDRAAVIRALRAARPRAPGLAVWRVRGGAPARPRAL